MGPGFQIFDGEGEGAGIRHVFGRRRPLWIGRGYRRGSAGDGIGHDLLLLAPEAPIRGRIFVTISRSFSGSLFREEDSPHVKAKGAAADGKGIFVIEGKNTTVENLEFSGCAVGDRNGAGIRMQGIGLTVRRCSFHDNENGILAGSSPANDSQSDILIEHSEFARNGAGDGRSHNMYIGHVRRFTLQFCYIHHAKVGHHVKSRGLENHILCNRIMDEETGNSSCEIDLPDGGLSYIIGNLLQKGPRAENNGLIGYAAEGGSNPIQELYVAHNTMVADYTGVTFVKLFKDVAAARLVNNIAVGGGAMVTGKAEVTGNVARDPLFVDRKEFNYRLRPESPAVGAGAKPGMGHGVDLAPRFEYFHPMAKGARSIIANPDVGAYQFSSRAPMSDESLKKGASEELKLGHEALAKGDYGKAYRHFESVVGRNDENLIPDAQDAMKRIAQVADRRIGEVQALEAIEETTDAIAAYREILREFSSLPAAEWVRKRLEELQKPSGTQRRK
jgi:hypothetical protein